MVNGAAEPMFNSPPRPPALVRRKLGLMTAVHTPWSGLIQAGLTVLGFYYHRHTLHTASVTGFHPLVVGPGAVGLVEPLVSFFIFSFGVSPKFVVCRIRKVHQPPLETTQLHEMFGTPGKVVMSRAKFQTICVRAEHDCRTTLTLVKCNV